MKTVKPIFKELKSPKAKEAFGQVKQWKNQPRTESASSFIEQKAFSKANLKAGTVTVTVNKSSTTIKKVGALSSKAPEKIRKNRLTEMKIYGENACAMLFMQRPNDIIRLWITPDMASKYGQWLSFLAQHKKVYHLVSVEELTKITGSEHHNGLCFLTKKAITFSLEGYLTIARQQDCLVLLEQVNNALNIGGIVRTCAFFGIKGIIVENRDLLYSSSAARIAEGGLEFVYSLEVKQNAIALEQLRQAGYQIIHLTQNKQAPLWKNIPLTAKVVFVLSETVSEQLTYPEDDNVRISLTNPLNSGLNIAVNSGILLSRWYQQFLI